MKRLLLTLILACILSACETSQSLNLAATSLVVGNLSQPDHVPYKGQYQFVNHSAIVTQIKQ